MIKPLTPIPLPRRGFASGMPYNDSSQEFTHECLNVLPFDTFEDKLRIASRQGVATLQLKTGIHAGTGSFQFLGYFKTFDANGEIKDGLIAIVDGEFFYNTQSSVARGAGSWTSMTDTDGNNAGTQQYPFNTDGSFDDRIQGVQVGDFFYFACSKYQDGTATSSTAGASNSGTSNSSILRPEYFKVKLNVGTATAPQWEEWLPTNAAGGALIGVADNADDHTHNFAAAGEGATIIANLGSRIVLSGQPKNPTNWFMSAIPDATHDVGSNWTVDTNDSTTALFGSSGTKFGTLGDNIVGMIPFGSNGLLFGCTNSMVLLTQDPAFSGAQFKSLSHSVGLVGPTAFANATGRSLYFIGTDGLYLVNENSFSIDESNKISDGRLDDAFDQTEWNEVTENIVYDQRRQGIWIYLTRTVAPLNSVHYFYHIPTNSFWPQVFNDPDFDGPKVATTVRPATSQTMYTVFANDSKICRFSEGATFGSDGYPDAQSTGLDTPSWQDYFNGFILSYVKIGPIYNPQRRRTRVKAIEIDMDIEEYAVPQLSTGTDSTAGTDVYPIPPETDVFLLSGETPEQAKGSAFRDKLLAQVLDSGDLQGTLFIATTSSAGTYTDLTDTSNTALNGGLFTAASSSTGSYETQSGNSLDGNYLVGVGEYVVTNPFEEGQGREYSGPDSCELVFESTYWKIKSGGTELFRSAETGLSSPTDASYYEDQTTTSFTDADYKTTLVITGSPASSYSVKNLGEVPAGRSNRKNLNVNAPAHYILIQGLGRPIILEEVAALIEDGGPNLKNTQTVVT